MDIAGQILIIFSVAFQIHGKFWKSLVKSSFTAHVINISFQYKVRVDSNGKVLSLITYIAY